MPENMQCVPLSAGSTAVAKWLQRLQRRLQLQQLCHIRRRQDADVAAVVPEQQAQRVLSGARGQIRLPRARARRAAPRRYRDQP